jgi:hypothetical protein
MGPNDPRRFLPLPCTAQLCGRDVGNNKRPLAPQRVSTDKVMNPPKSGMNRRHFFAIDAGADKTRSFQGRIACPKTTPRSRERNRITALYGTGWGVLAQVHKPATQLGSWGNWWDWRERRRTKTLTTAVDLMAADGVFPHSLPSVRPEPTSVDSRCRPFQSRLSSPPPGQLPRLLLPRSHFMAVLARSLPPSPS